MHKLYFCNLILLCRAHIFLQLNAWQHCILIKLKWQHTCISLLDNKKTKSRTFLMTWQPGKILIKKILEMVRVKSYYKTVSFQTNFLLTATRNPISFQSCKTEFRQLSFPLPMIVSPNLIDIDAVLLAQ